MGDDVVTLHQKNITAVIQKTFLIAFILWTGVIAILFIWDTYKTRSFAIKDAKSAALANYNKDVAFREWATMHGGVYVPVDKNTPPNPYLDDIEERDLITPSGKHLTLMNPAYMARQMNEFFATRGTVFGQITSLKLKNPINKPDKWEEDALRAFEKGEKERMELADINGKPFLRLMRPIITKEGCLKCHAKQGYKVGDIRGGVSIALDLEPYYEEARHLTREHAVVHGLIWLIGSLGILLGHRYTYRLGVAHEMAANEMAESEGRFRQLSQAAFEGVVIHAGGIILDCNTAYAAMMGYEPSEITGLPLLRTVAPEFHEEMNRRSREEHTEPLEALAVRKDGTRFYVETLGKTIVYRGEKARISLIYDLTRRKKVEEALKRSETLLNQTQQISRVGGWEYEVSSGKIQWTEEVYRIYGVGADYDPNNINEDIKFYTPADQAVIENAFKRAVEFGESYDLELQFTAANGAHKWVRTVGRAERDGGKVTRVFGNIMDITKRKRAEMEIVAAKEAAEEANRLKSEFLSNVTHELNTPLTSVLGYSGLANDRDGEVAVILGRIAEILERSDNSMDGRTEVKSLAKSALESIQEISKYDNIVLEQGQRLFNLLNDLMDLSMIESGNIRVAEHTVSTYILLTTIESYYKDAARIKGLTFSVNITDFRPVDLLFIGDDKWLEKALGNLVQNAIKFSTSGEIKITASREGGHIFFLVRDEGIGFKDGESAKIFDAFRQLDGSAGRSQGGVGLGLTLSRKIVNAMGGNISVKSEPGKGSEFLVTLPFRPVGLSPEKT